MQDEGLDVIGEGLETLKNMASDMNEVDCCTFFFGFYGNYSKLWTIN